MEIAVAAYGWQGDSWDAFYPEDFPPEWRLGYYANEFFAVVVPTGHWQGEPDNTLLTWLDDIHGDFRLYWEAGSAADTARLERLLEAEPRLAAHLGGVLRPDGEGDGWRVECSGSTMALLYIDEPLKPRSLRQAIEAAAGTAGRLLVVVAPQAQGVLHTLLPLTQMLGG